MLGRCTRIVGPAQPPAFIGGFFLETQTSATIWIHMRCIGLLVGRISHALGVSRANENPAYRVVRIVLTSSVIISASIDLMITYVRVEAG